MKAFAFTVGALSTSLITLGILFKMMYWPYATIMMVLGLAMMALLFIPTISIYWYNKKN